MLITINNGSKGSAKVQVPAEISKKVNEDYPELANDAGYGRVG